MSDKEKNFKVPGEKKKRQITHRGTKTETFQQK